MSTKTTKGTTTKAAPKTAATKKPATRAMFPTWTPKGDDAKHKCAGACGKVLPVKKFPTITGQPGVRGGECRPCRDARTKAAKGAQA